MTLGIASMQAQPSPADPFKDFCRQRAAEQEREAGMQAHKKSTAGAVDPEVQASEAKVRMHSKPLCAGIGNKLSRGGFHGSGCEQQAATCTLSWEFTPKSLSRLKGVLVAAKI